MTMEERKGKVGEIVREKIFDLPTGTHYEGTIYNGIDQAAQAIDEYYQKDKKAEIEQLKEDMQMVERVKNKLLKSLNQKVEDRDKEIEKLKAEVERLKKITNAFIKTCEKMDCPETANVWRKALANGKKEDV